MSRLDTMLAASKPYLADGGIETDLMFNRGIELPHFSAFVLLDMPTGRAALESYFDGFLDIAEREGRGFVLDTATWRANAGWAARHVLDHAGLRAVNRQAVRHAKSIRDRRTWSDRILINGCIGPAGDGYAPENLFSPEEAEALHRPQLEAFAEEGVDLASALTMTHTGEAIGVVRAARAAGVPIVISFTVETDGRLPVGQTLRDAIAVVDRATGGAPVYYGINCAHPTHFLDELDGEWVHRIGVVRANASRKSHAELDEASELDAGDPHEFGHLYAEIGAHLPDLRVVGGCCGSDHRHVGEVAAHI